jgi:hypothetical protein
MVAFIHRHAVGRPARASFRRCEIVESPAEELNATPTGDVIAAGSRPAYEVIADAARALDRSRPRLRGRALLAAVRETLGLDRTAGTTRGAAAPPHYRVQPARSYGSFSAARFALESEASDATIRAFLHQPGAAHAQSLTVPARPTLWLPHLASEIELQDATLARALVGSRPLFLLDARGLGESSPEGDFFGSYGSDYLHHATELMLGRSLLGRRVHDALRALDLLAAEGARGVDLIGRGQGALIALYAGALSPHVRTVELRNAPRSYLEWATAPVVRWPVANVAFGALMRFDLPDLVRHLGRRVRMIEPWDAMMAVVSGA